MKSFKMGSLIIAAMAVVGCASATVTEPSACDAQSVSFPTPSIPGITPTVDCKTLSSVTIPSESTTTTLDLSSDISKLQNVASSLNVNITELMVDNSKDYFDWVQELDVSMQDKAGSLPNILLAKYTKPATWSTEMNVSVVASNADVFKYLSSGPLTLTLTLQSQTMDACSAQDQFNTWAQPTNNFNQPTTLDSSATLCISASGKVTKSL